MISSKLSAKYQVVIPKELRQGLNMRPGQRVYLSAGENDELILTARPDVDQFLGVLQPAVEDPVAYQKRVRVDKSSL
ncbi:MAG TPA: AbrB/MazE/SpoVT family DNA-binding domain-containing protein [Candidatus Saccharimonadia bacterium]|nr:AbrB/MazE/SpoVT family DNA-binding domain-containing protein [Candidatus Saccharimonadia bacterium]